jgi:transcriptional regulator with XRE-family HTH domain
MRKHYDFSKARENPYAKLLTQEPGSMSRSGKRPSPEPGPVRILGRGLRAKRGVHLTFRAIREAVGKTQVEVATDSGMVQSDVSRLEARKDFEDSLVSTLRRYVTALGGEFELIASFGDRKIILTGISDSDAGPSKKPPLQAVKRARRR